MTSILERLKITPTVTLPQAQSVIPAAHAIRQMMAERAEAAAAIEGLLTALALIAGGLVPPGFIRFDPPESRDEFRDRFIPWMQDTARAAIAKVEQQ